MARFWQWQFSGGSGPHPYKLYTTCSSNAHNLANARSSTSHCAQISATRTMDKLTTLKIRPNSSSCHPDKKKRNFKCRLNQENRISKPESKSSEWNMCKKKYYSSKKRRHFDLRKPVYMENMKRKENWRVMVTIGKT